MCIKCSDLSVLQDFWFRAPYIPMEDLSDSDMPMIESWCYDIDGPIDTEPINTGPIDTGPENTGIIDAGGKTNADWNSYRLVYLTVRTEILLYKIIKPGCQVYLVLVI